MSDYDYNSRNGRYGQGSQNGQSQRKLTVHISDEDYENEIRQDSAELQRQNYERRQGGQQQNANRQQYNNQNGNQHMQRSGQGGNYDNSGSRQRVAQYGGGYNPNAQRVDMSVSRTRVVTSRSGETYEIPEENNIPAKLLRRQKKNTKSRGCLVAVVYAAIVCSISALLAFYLIVGINDMFALKKESIEVVVTVPENADLDTIIKLLDENGVVEYPFFFKMYALISNPDASFKDGDFKLNTKSDYDSLLTRLQQPAIAENGVVKVTIPEGFNVEQIAERLDYYCVCDYDKFFDTLQNYPFKHEFITDIPTDDPDRMYRLEGYLFPATYSFYINEGSVSAINKMLNAYVSNVLESASVSFTARASELGRSMDEIMIVASIIERETPDKEEMKNVASVFYNRLKGNDGEGINKRLQSDATRWYPYINRNDMLESDLPQSEKDLWGTTDADGVYHGSKYDTTVFQGLPPGPICCPSLNAIKAALNPNSTKYLYFFINDAGEHYYASTYSRHLENISNHS